MRSPSQVSANTNIKWQIKNILQRFLPFHKLFFIPVEVAEKDACYCCRILEEREIVGQK